jgi:hypothetical protein
MFYFEKARDAQNEYKPISGCGVGSLPFKYWAIAIRYRKLLNRKEKQVADYFERKLGPWLGKILSYGDRHVLINLVGSNKLTAFILSLSIKYQKG